MTLAEFNALPARLGFLGRDWDTPPATATWNPSVDIFENDNDVVIKAEVPGMNAKDFDVRLENNVLTIKGERKLETGDKGGRISQVGAQLWRVRAELHPADRGRPDQDQRGVQRRTLADRLAEARGSQGKTDRGESEVTQ